MKLTDKTASFITDEIQKDDYIHNITDNTYSKVTEIEDCCTITIKKAGWFMDKWLRFKSFCRNTWDKIILSIEREIEAWRRAK